MKKAHVTHPELKCTFCLDILGVKKNPNGASYTQLGVVTKGTIIEVRVRCCWPGSLHWAWACCKFPWRCCAGERERAGPGHARRQGRVGQVRAGEQRPRLCVLAVLHLHQCVAPAGGKHCSAECPGRCRAAVIASAKGNPVLSCSRARCLTGIGRAGRKVTNNPECDGVINAVLLV